MINRAAGEQRKIDKEIVYHIFLDALIIAFLVYTVSNAVKNRTIPFIYNDEYGYWASAAYFAGYDWSNIVSITSYYGYGYGFILSILLRVFPTSQQAYSAALVLNGVWWTGSFICIYKAARLLFPEKRKEIVKTVCFTAMLFPACIANMYYTWPEMLLVFLYSLNFLLMAYLKQSQKKMFYCVCIILINIYMYMVHQRTIGVVLVSCVCVLYICWRDMSPKKSLVCVLLILVGFTCQLCIKSNVINELWNNSSTVEGNNYSGQIEKLGNMLSLYGIWNFILSFVGKSYYVWISSFLFVFVALNQCIRSFVHFLKKKKNFRNWSYGFWAAWEPLC